VLWLLVEFVVLIFLVFCVVVFGGGSVVLIFLVFCVVVFGGGSAVLTFLVFCFVVFGGVRGAHLFSLHRKLKR
jgi:hypothetical protein